jgi:hypothetical protein
MAIWLVLVCSVALVHSFFHAHMRPRHSEAVARRLKQEVLTKPLNKLPSKLTDARDVYTATHVNGSSFCAQTTRNMKPFKDA